MVLFIKRMMFSAFDPPMQSTLYQYMYCDSNVLHYCMTLNA